MEKINEIPALVGSLTIGTTFLLSPVSGILTDKFGIRVTTFAGGAIASAGLFLSSVLLDKVRKRSLVALKNSQYVSCL